MMSQIDHFSDSSNDPISSIVDNKKQIFEIIDSIVSLESCLHFQFLPLALTDGVLTLGMINPKDRNGYNFIYPIVASLKYTLKISEINSQTHQLILAAYLKRDITETRNSDSNQPNSSLQSDLLKNSSQELSSSELNSSLTLIDIATNTHNNNQTPNLHDRATLIVDPQEELTSDHNSREDNISLSPPEIFSSEPQITSSNTLELNPYNLPQSKSNPHVLQVQAQYLHESVDTLSSLPPQQLWQELLARILDGGIGRLYLERHSHHGRIIWSRDGIVQSSLEKMNIAVFNHIIQEIKILGRQPSDPIEKPKKVAIEKYYNQERILVRIEFLLNQYGEEITVQILRNKALKFYEQRQVKKMMEQALSLSQKLEKILKKMIFCSNSGELNNISSLKSVFAQIEKQITLLEKKAKNPHE